MIKNRAHFTRRFASVLQACLDHKEMHIRTLQTTGLFGYDKLANPSDFISQAKLSCEHATMLTDLICSSDEPLKVLPRFDAISNSLCQILDSAELIRNVHPETQWVDSATQAYAYLHNYMNQLNTNVGLYESLLRTVKDPTVFRQLTEQQKSVASLLLDDFKKFGIQLDKTKRERIVKLNDDIQELGQSFQLNLHAEEQMVEFINAPVDLAGVSPKLIEALINATAHKSGKKALIPAESNAARYLLKTAGNPEVRRKIFMGIHASSPSQIETLKLLMRTRNKLAHELDFKSFAEMNLTDKMIKTPEKVNSFLAASLEANRNPFNTEFSGLEGLKRTHTQDPSAIFYDWCHLN